MSISKDKPLTPDLLNTVRRLACCKFAPATWAKRFVRDLEGMRVAGKLTKLSDNQYECLLRLEYMYRKQLSKIK